MKTMTANEFKAALKAQGVAKNDLTFICPACKTVQSANDLIKAGAGSNFDSVEQHLGFSCVGRFTGAASPRTVPDGEACNWTLGGFFKLHLLEVVCGDGKGHPHFEPATPEQAQAHAKSKGGAA